MKKDVLKIKYYKIKLKIIKQWKKIILILNLLKMMI
jgi:hypothetical protein